MLSTTENDISETQSLDKKIKKDVFLPEGPISIKIKFILKILLLLNLSAFLVAFSSHCLILPNNFATGGITGISIIVEKATNGKIAQSTSVFFINLPLIIASFFFVKRRFAVITALSVAFQTMWYAIVERVGFFPELIFEEEKLFAALAGGIGIGAAIALAFKAGGSSGGMDIIAVIVQKKCPAPSIAWMLFILNCMVITTSFFVFRTEDTAIVIQLMPILMAICEQFVESKTNDAITNGFQSAIEFRIVTDKPELMADEIFNRLGRGVTSIPAKGMYTGKEHSMLMCIINRRQINIFKKIMKDVDPDSFAVMTPVSQVLGLGFFSSEL